MGCMIETSQETADLISEYEGAMELASDPHWKEHAEAGDCFVAAVRFMEEADHPRFVLIHAIVTGTSRDVLGVQYSHGFVLDTQTDLVIDLSCGRRIVLPKQIYMAIGRVHPEYMRAYSKSRMLQMLAEHGHYGCWELPVDDSGVMKTGC